mgnify:CR=1 FL=1
MKRVNLIPMAGLGIRFVNAGYNIPKPLLDVNGLPMIIKSAQCLPDADKWIFVCRKEHLEKTNLEKILKFYFQNVFIIEINYLTEGQLSTCLIAEDYFTPVSSTNQMSHPVVISSFNISITPGQPYVNFDFAGEFVYDIMGTMGDAFSTDATGVTDIGREKFGL